MLVGEGEEEAERCVNPGEESERGWVWLEDRACRARNGQGRRLIASGGNPTDLLASGAYRLRITQKSPSTAWIGGPDAHAINTSGVQSCTVGTPLGLEVPL